MERKEGMEREADPLTGEHFPSGGLRIKIVGVGGAGTNAVDRIKLEDLEQVQLAAADTDYQVLQASPVEETLLLGSALRNGKSAGGVAEAGQEAAEAEEETLRRCFRGQELVFLLCGLGGGTGSGAAPVMARMAREEGALVIAFAALPFRREGTVRNERARKALEVLRKESNALIAMPNDLIFREVDENATLMEAFATADRWIRLGVHAIWSMLFHTGFINVDFSSLRAALAEPGRRTLFATGYGKGETLVEDAVADLEACPLLQMPESGLSDETDQLILNLTGGPDLTMGMVNEVLDAVAEKFGCRQSVVFGASIDGGFYNQLRITAIGTVRSPKAVKQFPPQSAASIAPNKPPEAKHESPPKAVPASWTESESLSKPANRDESANDFFSTSEETESTSGSLAPTSSVSFGNGTAGRAQEEFAFPRHEENRGLFEKTDPNLYEGEDLDIPTYLRRGLKIATNC